MKRWNFKAHSNPQTILKKLEAALRPVNGFIFNVDSNKNDSVTFKVTKRVLYASQIILHNKVIVNGNMLNTEAENETNVEINFNQHFLTALHILIWLGAGLILTIAGIVSNPSLLYVLGGISLIVAIAIWIDIQKKFKENTQKYKTLISGILEID